MIEYTRFVLLACSLALLFITAIWSKDGLANVAIKMFFFILAAVTCLMTWEHFR